jgi:hypothetical protein
VHARGSVSKTQKSSVLSGDIVASLHDANLDANQMRNQMGIGRDARHRSFTPP